MSENPYCLCWCHQGSIWPFPHPHRYDPLACLEACDLCAPLHPINTVQTPPRRKRGTPQADGEGAE